MHLDCESQVSLLCEEHSIDCHPIYKYSCYLQVETMFAKLVMNNAELLLPLERLRWEPRIFNEFEISHLHFEISSTYDAEDVLRMVEAASYFKYIYIYIQQISFPVAL